MRALVLFVVLGLSACREGASPGASGGSTAGTGGPSAASAPGAADAPSAATTAGNPEVRGLPKPSGEVELEVLQRGRGRVSLAAAVRLEREVDGRFVDAGAEGLTLRPSCDREAPRCTELAAGFALRPPAWNGRVGGPGQCQPATAGRRAEPGVYRFVLAGCGGEQVVGSPFEVSP